MNIKSLSLFFITAIMIMGCKKTEEPNTEDSIEGIWLMVNKTGGFAGVDCDYDIGLISWTFDSSTLTIDNTDTLNTIPMLCEELDSASFPYSILDVDGDSFLIWNNEEQGGITISDNELIIDQNRVSNGAGADGFIWRFER